MRIARIGVFILLLSGGAGGASDFLTEGVDNARTGWVRDEKIFTKANVGGMKLLWKIKLESPPRAMHNLFAPLVAERVTTAQGTRELAVVAGVTDDMFGIDVAPANRSGTAASTARWPNRGARTTRSVPADRPRCRPWRKCRRGSTRSTRFPGMEDFGS